MAGITPTFYQNQLSSPSGYYPTPAQQGAAYLNTVLPTILPNVIYENLYKATPTLRYVLSKCSKPLENGWAPIMQNVALSSFTKTGGWTDFTGSFNAPVISNPLVTLQFMPAMYVEPISYTVTELANFSTKNPQAVVDVVAQRITDIIHQDLIMLSQTFFGSMGTDTLKMQGLGDIVDNGTNQSYYGGLSRATYPGLNAIIYNNTDTTTPAYQLLYKYILSYLKDTNNLIPDFFVTSPAVFAQLATSMTSIERIIVQDPSKSLEDRDYGINTLSIQGTPVIVDTNITDPVIYGIDIDNLNFYYDKNLCFKMTDPESTLPLNQLAYVQAYTIAGQFVSFMPTAFMAITNMQATTLY